VDDDAPRATRRRHRRRLGALAGLALAIGGIAVAVVALNSPVRHVTVVRLIVPPGATAVDDEANPASTTPSPPASPPLLGRGAVASFERLNARLPGHVELAVSPVGAGATEILGGDVPAHGWSTTKVPVLVSLLRARGAAGLTSTERGWASAAITASDNESILELFGDLEQLKGGLIGASDYVDTVLRRSGDIDTTVATGPPPPGAVTTFGQTEWSPSESLKFFRALARGCLLPVTQTDYVLGLMEDIVPSESWGLGSGHFGVPVAFKGGWGPEPSGRYLVRQSGVIDVGSSRGVAVAIVAFPSAVGSASFPAGTQILTATAQWLRRELRLAPHPSAGCPTR
jgi:hypothetical protein